jgi:hypothetical protein
MRSERLRVEPQRGSCTCDWVGRASKTPDRDEHCQQKSESQHPANGYIHISHRYLCRIRVGQRNGYARRLRRLARQGFPSPGVTFLAMFSFPLAFTSGIFVRHGLVLPFTEEFKNSRERLRFHTFTAAYQHDCLAIRFCDTCAFPNPGFEDSSSKFFIRNGLPVAIFCAVKVHQTQVVSLLPSPTSFLPDIAVLIRNNMAPS